MCSSWKWLEGSTPGTSKLGSRSFVFVLVSKDISSFKCRWLKYKSSRQKTIPTFHQRWKWSKSGSDRPKRRDSVSLERSRNPQNIIKAKCSAGRKGRIVSPEALMIRSLLLLINDLSVSWTTQSESRDLITCPRIVCSLFYTHSLSESLTFSWYHPGSLTDGWCRRTPLCCW